LLPSEPLPLSPVPHTTRSTPLSGFGKSWRKHWQLYVMLAVPLLYVFIFKYGPMYGAQVAFRDYVPAKGIWDSRWVGLDNIRRFFTNYDFWRIMRNTLGLSLYYLVAQFPFPILLALSLSYVKWNRFRKMAQLVTYAPHFISVVVIVGMILQFLDPRTGIVNVILGLFGVDPVDFMGNPANFKSVYVWSQIWQNVGFQCIIFLAALSSIDPSLHEAAVMDGASKLQRMRHIDLPGLLPIAVILLILQTGRMMDIGFQKVLLMQNPVNLRTSEIIDTYVYKVGLASQALNYSYATAIGLFKNAINLILILFVNSIAKKLRQESLW
jgi:multiple sugar transport system permease protein/putative aldouronate transport system permease protein